MDNQLLTLLQNTLKYEGIVYNQSSYSTNMESTGTLFTLEYKHTSIPEDSLLFFVPAFSSSGPSQLKIRVPYKVAGEVDYRYTDKIYDIVVETNNGLTRTVAANDIIAYRMCIFRFKKGSNKIILCNSPLYDEALFSSLRVTNCEFLNVPTIVNNDNANDIITLTTSKQLLALEERVAALEQKIIFGTEDPDVMLSGKPAGTVYIQIEED